MHLVDPESVCHKFCEGLLTHVDRKVTVVTVFPCERCAEEEVDISKEVDVAALTELFLKEEFLGWIG